MNDLLETMIQAARNEATSRRAPSGTPCACEGRNSETIVAERVPIGEEGDFFEVEVPILRCDSCGLRFRDHRAETLRHAAASMSSGRLGRQEPRTRGL